MTLAHKTITNSIASFIGFLFMPIAAFIITPLALSQLGDVQYGIYAIFFTIITLLNFLDFGLSYASIRFITEAYELKQFSVMRRIINMNVTIFMILTTVITVLSLFFLNPFVSILNIPEEFIFTTKIGFILTMIAVGAFLIASSYRAVLQAYQRYIIINVVNIALIFITTVLTLLTLYYIPRLDILVGILALNNTLNVFIFVVIIKRLVPLYHFRFTFDIELFKKIFNFSGLTFIIMISYQILVQFDKFFISSMLGPAQLTRYSIPINITTRMRDSIANINNVLFPLATQLHAGNKKDELIILYQKVTKINMIGLVAMGVPLFVYSDKIISLWIGEEYVDPVSLLLKLGVIGYSFYTLTSIPAQLLGALDLQKKNMYFHLSFTITNVILLFILVPDYGIIGAAFAFICAFWAVPIMYLYIEHKIKAPLKKQLIMYVRLAAVIIVATTGAYYSLPYIQSIWSLIFTLLAGGMLIIGLSSIIVLDADDRSIYFSYIKKLIPKRSR